ncbi:hypothetical protein KVR01_005161 [Diaporthe batatas]|uniref:uncharacterized protein n=1 Tax=Diaporthe batatas TaxID=748121 RepID=UPI001D055C5B|nr:uncharacterized protein KVR01_005161 [Diaporthe batatas]KAG8164886.1 hypothetical protein KVR01_005161 [Diaporthe batatas]
MARSYLQPKQNDGREHQSLPSPVLVVGGCGFLGSHLVKALLSDQSTDTAQYQVHALDIRTDRNRVQGAAYHSCDITSADQVKSVFLATKPKVVFHVASPDPLSHNNALFQQVNVKGTQNLLEAAKAVHTQAFIYTSSFSAVHNHTDDIRDADESLPVLRYPAQQDTYTLTKVAAEDKLRAANRADDSSLLTAIIRPAVVFGEGDFQNFWSLVQRARSGRANFQIGDGTNLYSYTYVGNLVDAHLLAAEALVRAHGKPPPPAESRVDGEAFFITNDEDWPFWDYQRAGAASVGYPVRKDDIKVIPMWLALVVGLVVEWVVWLISLGKRHSVLSRQAVRYSCINRTLRCDKAKRVLGYRPKVSMAEAIGNTGAWFVQEFPEAGKTQKTV